MVAPRRCITMEHVDSLSEFRPWLLWRVFGGPMAPVGIVAYRVLPRGREPASGSGASCASGPMRVLRHE